MKTWQDLCAEPERLKEKSGREMFRFINEEDFKAIQLDAYKAGMTEAVKIMSENRMFISYHTENLILTARDSKKEL